MSHISLSPSSTWYHINLKLRFFTRIRQFLRYKSTSGNCKSYRPPPTDNFDVRSAGDRMVDTGGGKLEEMDGGDWMAVLRKSVKKINFGSWEEKELAAIEIKRLAGEDLRLRKLMAELGVIPPLVTMVGSGTAARRRLAVQALLELANGTCTNKALMVEAGILSKLPKEDMGVIENSAEHELALLVLSLSSLANAQFPINSSNVLPFVLDVLESDSSIDTKELCLGTLYNLSTMLDIAGILATNNRVVHALLSFSSVKETSEKALVTLGNLVVTFMGKKALENNPLVPENLIEVMTWEEKPKSQELSAYILMILAYQSSVQRVKMAKAGIVPVLLEVALLGSPLAQKRALKLLQWFKDERQTRMGPHSGPQTRRLSIGSPTNREEVDMGKKMMKRMVKQSLYKNMETITRRANGSDGDPNSKIKFFVISSSSKSLPY